MQRAYRHEFDRTRYKRAYLMGGLSEAEVQQEVVTTLRDRYGLVLTVTDAGAKKTRGRVAAAARAAGMSRESVAKVSGARSTEMGAGHADLSGCLAPNGRAVYIEMKAPGQFDAEGRPLKGRRPGQPTPDQLQFLDEKAAHGALVGVAWSLQDVLEILGPSLEAHAAAVRSSKV